MTLITNKQRSINSVQVLVPSCVFLSPLESRRGVTEARVRSFGAGHAAPLAAARAQRWDRLRLVCAQPYNTHCKYGLNFVHIDECESSSDAATSAAGAVTSAAGAVTSAAGVAMSAAGVAMRAAVGAGAALSVPAGASSDEEEFRPGELFAQRFSTSATTRTCAKDTTATASPRATDTGAQIRQATSQVLKNISDSSTKLVKANINKKRTSTADERDTHTPNKRHRPDTRDTDTKHDKRDTTPRDTDTTYDKRDTTPCDTDTKYDKRDTTSHDTHRKHDKRDTTPRDTDTKHDKRDTIPRDTDTKHDKRDTKPKDKFDKLNYKNDSKEKSQSEKKREDKESSRDVNNGASTSREEKKKTRPRGKQALETVLAGTVLVFSGYENPERSDLRNMALEMGARVDRNWTERSTHLICAFPNTPKLREAKASRGAGGGVVRAATGAWVRACRARARRVPWAAYATEPQHATAPESDEERSPSGTDTEQGDTDDEIEKVLRKQRDGGSPRGPPRRPASPKAAHPSPKAASPSPKAASPSLKATSPSPAASPLVSNASDSDYGGSTDEDTEGGARVRLEPARLLPAALAGRALAVTSRAHARPQLLRRYVRAYGGEIIEESQLDADSKVDIVICGGAPPPALRGARAEPPAWLWRCHETGHADL